MFFYSDLSRHCYPSTTSLLNVNLKSKFQFQYFYGPLKPHKLTVTSVQHYCTVTKEFFQQINGNVAQSSQHFRIHTKITSMKIHFPYIKYMHVFANRTKTKTVFQTLQPVILKKALMLHSGDKSTLFCFSCITFLLWI